MDANVENTKKNKPSKKKITAIAVLVILLMVAAAIFGGVNYFLGGMHAYM